METTAENLQQKVFSAILAPGNLILFTHGDYL